MSDDHALFLDRDGTIIKDCEGALIESNIRFEDGLKDFIRFAIEKKFKIIMITNQTSVSKGLFSFSQMIKMNNIVLKRVNDLLKQEVFNEIFICPFHPNAQVLRYKLDSEDRKPKPGMLLKAQKKLNLNLNKSIMVGDRVSDIVAGNLAGCKTVMKINNYSSLKMITTDLKYSKNMTVPDYKVNKLIEIIPIMDSIL